MISAEGGEVTANRFPRGEAVANRLFGTDW